VVASCAELQNDLHDAETDLNYCLYAPLNQPYFSLYPTNERGNIIRRRKGGKSNKRKMLDPEKMVLEDATAGILRSQAGEKPPFWHEIRKRMDEGTLHEVKLLHDLINADSRLASRSIAEVGDRISAFKRLQSGHSLKRSHSWDGR